jgi:DNA (cytosine-5)-methyltransferase 1
MKVLSLFSGIGGFDLALQQQGHELIGACEIEQNARSIYARHFPTVKIYTDATKIKAEELPTFDLLCAGFPCQSFSIAGNRHGFNDTRGNLFFEITRIAKRKKPKYLFLENVKGLLNHDNGKTFITILNTLNEIGYDAEWQVINSKYFIPQNRERIYIIGHLRTKPTRKVFRFNENIKPIHREKNLKQLGNIDTKNNNSIWGRVYDINHISVTLNALGGGLGAKTGLYLMPESNRIRKLTPLECERLQGFPDNWTLGLSDSQRYKCVGNAVTVPVIDYIAKGFEK